MALNLADRQDATFFLSKESGEESERMKGPVPVSPSAVEQELEQAPGAGAAVGSFDQT